MIQKVGSIALFVQDLAECTAFYRDTVGLPYQGSETGLSVFRLQEGLMLILLSREGAAEIIGTDATALEFTGGPRGWLTVYVADVDATYEDLRAKGVRFVQLPTDKPWGLRMAHFTDPEGNLWEICQPIAAKPEE